MIQSISFYPKFKILNFGNEEIETGSSSIPLLNKVNISKLTRLANPAGTPESKTACKHCLDFINKQSINTN